MRIFDMTRRPAEEDLPMLAPGWRTRGVQRLQVGVAGVALMLLLVSLASVIQDRASQSDAATVPGAASTMEPAAAASEGDPLVEAGIVPGLVADPVSSPQAPAPAAARPAPSSPAP